MINSAISRSIKSRVINIEKRIRERMNTDDLLRFASLSNVEVMREYFNIYREAKRLGWAADPLEIPPGLGFPADLTTWGAWFEYVENEFFQLCKSSNDDVRHEAEQICKQIEAAVREPKESPIILLKVEPELIPGNAVPEECEPEAAIEVMPDVTADTRVTRSEPKTPDVPEAAPLAPRGDIVTRMVLDYQDRRRRVDEFDPPA
jgi:hypothetical protein